MGGKAFSSGPEPLLTPRMPREVYAQVLKNVKSLLSSHFEHVGAPIEGPGKIDYGDIDILVADPISDLPEPKVQSLAKILGAAKWINSKHTYNFALPYPELSLKDGVGGIVEAEEQQEQDYEIVLESKRSSAKFVQVDLHICDSVYDLNWNIFHQAHGDLWNIIGSTIRKQGFTVNNTGLYIRIPSIEQFNRKRALVFLSSDPEKILRFLGLDSEKWKKEFRSSDEMFEYATTCRFFYVRYDNTEEEPEDGEEKGVVEDKRLLKSNDRKRIEKRPVFREWVEKYIPILREKDLFHVSPVPLEKVTEMAFDTFGDVPKAEYNTRLTEWKKEKNKEDVKGVIREAVPMPDVERVGKGTKEWQLRSAALRGLQAIALDGNTDDGISLEDGILKEDGFYELDKVRSFAERRWKEVGDVRWAKIQEQAAKCMQNKKATLFKQEDEIKVICE